MLAGGAGTGRGRGSRSQGGRGARPCVCSGRVEGTHHRCEGGAAATATRVGATRSRFSPQLIAARFSPRHMANRGEKSRSARGCCTAQTAERSVPIRPCCVHVLPFSSDRCRRSHLWTRTACPKMAGSSRRSRRTSIPYPRSLASNPLRDRWPAPGNSGQAQGDAVTWNHATPHPTSRAHPPRRRNPALRARLLRRLRP